MDITNGIAMDVRKFIAENHGRKPDRLIINYHQYNELRADVRAMAYYRLETFMGMKIITTGVAIDGGFEVR